MCGIAGLMALDGTRDISQPQVKSMCDAMVHRGPDGEGYHLGAGYALGHRRLSVIDIDGGVQPMVSGDKQAVVTFNGEIYNAPEIRKELEAKGHVFASNHSDTEVILYAYREWGEDCVNKFRGMFAFALWDDVRDIMFLARDRMGIKPLYYTILDDQTFAFASELKGILALGGGSRDLCPKAVEEYMALGYVPDPRSIIKGVYKLSPGMMMTVQQGQVEPVLTRYWDLDFTSPDNGNDHSEILMDQLRDAVETRMVADVPLGAFLSGGVDSSAVVSVMAGLSDRPVETCSIGFSDPEYDETMYAEKVANQFKTHHRTALIDHISVDEIDPLVNVFDEPFADVSAIPTLRVCALARENVTVALSGDGGDELFAGYRRQLFHMREHNLRKLLPHGFRKVIFGALGKIYPKLDFFPRFLRAKSTFEALAMTESEAYCHSVSRTAERDLKKLRSAAFDDALDGYRTKDLFATLYEQAPADDVLSRIQYIDFKTFLAGGVLTKVDRASMAKSLEVRVPILDHLFVEWAAKIPWRQRIKSGQSKNVFKKALKSILPHELLYRSKKGFTVPISKWLKHELRDEALALASSDSLLKTGLFNGSAIAAMSSEHMSGIRDHSTTLWSLIMLDRSLKSMQLN